jgi:branched-subunit amino acid aminotransferase/4-amino-4-deoxychorismate lyase
VEAIWHERGPQLRYHQRSAPPWSSQVIVARAPHDPRRTPRVKGPDLEALLKLRDHVAPLGAGEALIVNSEDALSEGAYSTVMVWSLGGKQLHIVPHGGRLPSITERLLISLAIEQGIPVMERAISVSALEGSDVWIVSALHGIRQAMAFVDGPPLATDTSRRDLWQARWRALATHLDAPAPQESR